MERSRIDQREDLLLSLQELLLPIKRLIESTDPRDLQQVAIVRYDFQRDADQYCQELLAYCQLGDRQFHHEWDHLRSCIFEFLGCLNTVGRTDIRPTAKEQFDRLLDLFKKQLRALPYEDPATVIPPASPFSASRRIRAILRDAQQRIELFDPWLSAEVFYRYLPVISPGIVLTVVTEEVKANDSNKKSRERWEGVKAVAPMVEVEYPHFRLLVVDSFHDRWLRVDDTAYHLGGSVKDAGTNDPYTISTLDQHLYSRLDNVIARAKPWK